ncbi:hypothetical protein DINM_006767 [Dirofilaria immitis]|nr:hypothetical protein [Dirofilaria immitis]
MEQLDPRVVERRRTIYVDVHAIITANCKHAAAISIIQQEKGNSSDDDDCNGSDDNDNDGTKIVILRHCRGSEGLFMGTYHIIKLANILGTVVGSAIRVDYRGLEIVRMLRRLNEGNFYI